jgi:hypothetical protein
MLSVEKAHSTRNVMRKVKTKEEIALVYVGSVEKNHQRSGCAKKEDEGDYVSSISVISGTA